MRRSGPYSARAAVMMAMEQARKIHILREPSFFRLLRAAEPPLRQGFSYGKRLHALLAPHRIWVPGLSQALNKKTPGPFLGPPKLLRRSGPYSARAAVMMAME